MEEYSMSHFREQFRGLAHVSDTVLLPLFDYSVRKWMTALHKSSTLISDSRRIVSSSKKDHYICSIYGQLGDIVLPKASLNGYGKRMISSVYFNAGGAHGKWISTELSNFLSTQKLENIIEETAQTLQKRKGHLDAETEQFYFHRNGR